MARFVQRCSEQRQNHRLQDPCYALHKDFPPLLCALSASHREENIHTIVRFGLRHLCSWPVLLLSADTCRNILSRVSSNSSSDFKHEPKLPTHSPQSEISRELSRQFVLD